MKILITGATGFVGGTLLRHCISSQHEVAVFSRRAGPPFLDPSILWFQGSFENIPHLMQCLSRFQPDWILHCAGAGSVPLSMENPAEDFKNSASLTQNLLEAIRMSSSKARLAIMSSAALYGNPQALPICENAPVQPLSPYGWHRSMAEQLFLSYQQSFGIEGVICRIFSAYGEHLRKQVVYDTFRKLHSKQEKCEFWGTGLESRDFLHADDMARAILLLCNKEARGTFNLASGTQTYIKDLVLHIAKITCYNQDICFSGHSRPGDPLNWEADIQKLKTLGFQPQITINDGLERVWKWLQNEHPQQLS
jgi:UDP-glucose 4-epimerase